MGLGFGKPASSQGLGFSNRLGRLVAEGLGFGNWLVRLVVRGLGFGNHYSGKVYKIGQNGIQQQRARWLSGLGQD